MQRRSLHRQIPWSQYPLLPRGQRELYLALDLNNKIETHGAVHWTGGIGWRVDVPDRGTASGWHEGWEILQEGLVGFDVDAVGENGWGWCCDVSESNESAAEVVGYWKGGGDRGGEEGLGVGVDVCDVSVWVWKGWIWRIQVHCCWLLLLSFVHNDK